ncbi:3-deoxy-D-manno-octulosonate 8-phosphate phosphatase KdsC [Usitatibacter rugosus]|uniref:3-deoxy-D-manno-octulosonate 8-phosphate phosphatase KdsC n=1 Tax=Usitatibacter rugosus TaxID=2732067 RepID=A0A6M4GRS3_9PROT|nr:HAD-IIIA family hydrolase [Usitatibacter rugosus]QJR09033.1 3-deoxy-D-manno-octulosonate 8-phosphate phosphatase KdsC [Usitatibacter rugosus]
MSFAKRASAIKLAVFDVDGVLTDGTIYMGPSGEMLKAFNILDGHGLKLLHEDGIATAILSGRKSAMVATRAKELGLGAVHQGVADKVKRLATILRAHKSDLASCAYMGDDLPDLEVMRRVGLAVAPANGVLAVRKQAHLVTKSRGGEGAVREFCERLLEARGRTDLVQGRTKK